MMADGQNTISGGMLRSYLERVERLIEDRKGVADEIRAVYAEAKVNGFTPKYLKAIVRLRALPLEERQEDAAMMDLYMSAIGMAREAPLFAAAGMMGEDAAAREAVIEALKTIAPASGEFIVKCGGPAIRIWRDADGIAQAEEVVEPSEKPKRQRKAAEPEPDDGPVLPDITEGGAISLGRADANLGQPITANPFPFGDRRRAKWDFGWRDHTGTDGMGPDDGGDDE